MYFRSCVVYKLLFRSALSFFIWFFCPCIKYDWARKNENIFSLKILSFSYFLMKSSLLKWGKYRIKRSIYFAMFRQKFLFKRFFVIFINILTNLIIVFAFYSCASDLSLDAYLDALPCNQENPVYDLMYICTWRHVCMFSACYKLETVRHYSPCLCQIRLIKFDCWF